MAFWSTATEPDRQYRWYMTFGDTRLAGLTYALKKASRPTMKITEIQHKYLNHFFYYPGRVEWEPISVTLASVKGANSAFINSLKTSGYFFPTDVSTGATTNTPPPAAAGGSPPPPNNRQTISKQRAITAVAGGESGTRSIKLVQINAEGKDFNTWHLWNPFFTDVKYDSLEYASEEILNIDCTIKFDYATLNNEQGGLMAL